MFLDIIHRCKFHSFQPLSTLANDYTDLLTRPWITKGILTSIQSRDHAYKLYLRETYLHKKVEIYNTYKLKRNLITYLIRKIKCEYYVSFFEDNKTDSKKTWEAIRNIVNVSKQIRVVPLQSRYKDHVKYDNKWHIRSTNFC